MIRLWLDDRRPAPEGWVWARNVAEAQAILTDDEPVDECSLDHDLGLDIAVDAGVNIDDMEAVMDFIDSVEVPEQTGMDLVEWMIAADCVPAKITIHSWNVWGARKMAQRFNDYGYSCTIEPFKEVNP